MWLPNLQDDAKHPINLIGNTRNDNGFKRGVSSGLVQIANAMQLVEGQTPVVNSIPDIYYDACRFTMSLFYKDGDDGENGGGFLSEYSKRALAEWRAILAVCITAGVALKGSNYSVKLSGIDNPGSCNYTEAALNMKPVSEIWRPKDYNENKGLGVKAANDWTWNGMKAIVLHCDTAGVEDITIAFTSPVTVLYPAADWYAKITEKCSGAFPWVQMNGFYDPSNPDIKLPKQRAAYIVDWLEDFRVFLRTTETARDSEGNKRFDIIKNDWFLELCNKPVPNAGPDTSLLSKFRRDLEAAYALNTNNNISAEWKTWDFNNQQDYLGDCSIADIIPSAPTLPNTADGIYTDVLVNGISIDGKPALYLDESTREQIAAGVYTVGDALYKPEVRLEIEKVFSILASEDIFLDKIYYSQYTQSEDDRQKYLTCVDDACIYKDDNGRRVNVCFMPLTQSGLELAKAGGNYAVEPNYDEYGFMSGLEVSFTLSLKNGNELPPIKKMYKTGEQMEHLSWTDKLPIAAVWPRIDPGPFWKQFWVFAYDTPDSEVDSGQKPLGTRYSYEPIDDCELVKPDMVARAGDTVNHKYYSLKAFPSFLKLLEEDAGIGYIKLKPEPHSSTNNLGNYTFSLDFGTASTVIYGRPGGRPRPLDLAGDKAYGGISLGAAYITGVPFSQNIGAETQRSLYLSKYFLRDIEMPFATLLHDYEPQNMHKERHLYKTSHIYHKELRMREQRVLDDDKVISNLKWAQGVNKKHITVFFLELFGLPLLDAVANGLTSLNNMYIRASYPDSMQPHIRNSYMQTINDGIALAAKTFTNFAAKEKVKTEFVTESEAAARYFIAKLKASSKTPARLCVIDIGGGTSDIYYTETYRDEESETVTLRALESSLKIGARDILVKALFESNMNSQQNHRGEFTQYYLYELLMAADLLRDNNENMGDERAPLGFDDIYKIMTLDSQFAFAANWEGLLNRKYSKGDEETTLGERLLLHWGDHTQTRTAKDKKILSAIALNLGGIAYYTAMLLRASRNNDPNTRLHVAFAGNGSKMLDWLGSVDVYKHFFSKIMMDALSFGEKDMPQSIEIHTSADRKLEAADGMFVEGKRGELDAAARNIEVDANDDNGGEKKKLKALPIIIAGERFTSEKALSVEDCEKLLKDAYKNGNERASQEFEQAKKDKKNLSDSPCLNDAICDLSERDILSGELLTKHIESNEFENFINAYNKAIRDFPDGSLLPVDMTKIEADPRPGRILINWNKWYDTRQSYIDNYINKMKSAVNDNGQRPDELDSFFLMEIKALNEWVMQQL